MLHVQVALPPFSLVISHQPSQVAPFKNRRKDFTPSHGFSFRSQEFSQPIHSIEKKEVDQRTEPEKKKQKNKPNIHRNYRSQCRFRNPSLIIQYSNTISRVHGTRKSRASISPSKSPPGFSCTVPSPPTPNLHNLPPPPVRREKYTSTSILRGQRRLPGGDIHILSE